MGFTVFREGFETPNFRVVYFSSTTGGGGGVLFIIRTVGDVRSYYYDGVVGDLSVLRTYAFQ